MELLLDTHVFLWWDSQDASLNAAARAAIADPGNRVFVSAASIWEISIKRRSGKLAFEGSAAAAINANGFFGLAILPIAAEEAGALAWDHADLFDRMLIAQARHAGLTLVTADSQIRAYDAAGALLWAG